MTLVRILLIEQPIFSHFLQNLVQKINANLTIVGVAKNLEDALAQIQIYAPDVLLMELNPEEFPHRFQILAQIRAVYPSLQVIVHFQHCSTEVLLQAINVGVVGYLSDLPTATELLEAIEAVRQGKVYLPQNLTNQFVSALQHPSFQSGWIVDTGY